MKYEQCVDYIISIPLFGKKDGHKNTRILLERLNNPQKNMKFIHVAGTNGKGSVCTMLSFLYSESQVQVGLFTSPHLVKINERIKVNNKDISDIAFMNVFHEVKTAIDQMVEEGLNHPTFFETLFAMAIVYYNRQGVEIAILETGIGGRLDATNVIENPLVSVITHIGYDHMEILGNTLDKIAFEKGGIIKMGCPTVLSSQEPLARNMILQICKEKKSFLHEVMPLEYAIIKRTDKTIDFSVKNKYYNYERLTLNVSAEYQIFNLATALTVVEVIKKEYPLQDRIIKAAIDKFYWPGRMELVKGWLMLDGAHNESGIQLFVQNLEASFPGKKVTILFTAMRDKAYELMIETLSQYPNIEKVIITRVNNHRCLDTKVLLRSFEKNGFKDICIELDLDKVIKTHDFKNDGILCCVGSLYLVGEIKKIIAGGVLND